MSSLTSSNMSSLMESSPVIYGSLRGLPDSVAYQVLEVLRLRHLQPHEPLKIAQVKHEHEQPPLSQMITVQEWQALNTRYGSAIPYAQAFLSPQTCSLSSRGCHRS